MDETFQKIRAVHKINEEIIAGVEATKEAVLLRYNVTHTPEGNVEIKETRTKLKVADLIREHKFKGQFETEIWDIFHDQADTGAKSWEDLKRLNRALMVVVEKFELFDKPKEKARAELRKYLHDFEIIQVGLGALQELTLSHSSRLKDLQADAKEINKKINCLIHKVATFNPRTPIAQSPIRDFAGGLLSQRLINTLIEWYKRGWKLQYKATRDGWSSTTFHDLCDKKGSTVTIIRANGFLFGGRLLIQWEHNESYAADRRASLFTLTNKFATAPTQFPVLGDGGAAAYSMANYGPTFGGGHDIHISDNASSNKSSYSKFPHAFQDTVGKGYEIFAGTQNFTPDEVEVYIRENTSFNGLL